MVRLTTTQLPFPGQSRVFRVKATVEPPTALAIATSAANSWTIDTSIEIA
jgi:hypothetical protein